MSKEERRLRRERQREEEVVETVEKLRTLERGGLDPQVTPDGRLAGFIGEPSKDSLKGGHSKSNHRNFIDVKRTYEDLHEMYKSDRERDILIEAWNRFQEEE